MENACGSVINSPYIQFSLGPAKWNGYGDAYELQRRSSDVGLSLGQSNISAE
jgi:hypothetical protein